MNRFVVVCLGFVLTALGPGKAVAQQPQPDAGDIEAELDRFREGLFTAFNKGEYRAMLEKYCHKDVIATWQDGTTSQGYEGVIAEFDKLSKFIDKMTVHPETEMRLILSEGNLVIASGTMKDEYALSRGVDVALDSRWTATLVKEDDKWVLVSFSASTNAFDNEVSDLFLRKAGLTTGGIAAVVGLVLGILGAAIWCRRRKAST